MTEEETTKLLKNYDLLLGPTTECECQNCGAAVVPNWAFGLTGHGGGGRIENLIFDVLCLPCVRLVQQDFAERTQQNIEGFYEDQTLITGVRPVEQEVP